MSGVQRVIPLLQKNLPMIPKKLIEELKESNLYTAVSYKKEIREKKKEKERRERGERKGLQFPHFPQCHSPQTQ